MSQNPLRFFTHTIRRGAANMRASSNRTFERQHGMHIVLDVSMEGLQLGSAEISQIAAALFAGTAPYILTWLLDVTGNLLSPGLFLLVVGLVGVVTVISIPVNEGCLLVCELKK